FRLDAEVFAIQTHKELLVQELILRVGAAIAHGEIPAIGAANENPEEEAGNPKIRQRPQEQKADNARGKHQTVPENGVDLVAYRVEIDPGAHLDPGHEGGDKRH